MQTLLISSGGTSRDPLTDYLTFASSRREGMLNIRPLVYIYINGKPRGRCRCGGNSRAWQGVTRNWGIIVIALSHAKAGPLFEFRKLERNFTVGTVGFKFRFLINNQIRHEYSTNLFYKLIRALCRNINFLAVFCNFEQFFFFTKKC